MNATGAGTDVIQELVQDAVATGTPLRVSGRSHWMDAMRPVGATRIASLAAHSGIVDYVPGDLTITVRSGTTLREIVDVTHAEGQWLPIDPFGPADGTIGATIATGSFGPLAHSFGRIRDLVLGVEFVSGTGAVVRGGGRVVKNVAGFDLVRLITGSWGTLGILTEATLRLYSLPSPPISISVDIPEDPVQLSAHLVAILSSPGTAFAMELLDPAISARVGLARKPQLLVMLGGNAAGVAAQKSALAGISQLTEVDRSAWGALRNVEAATTEDKTHSPPIVVRLSTLPSRLAELWSNASSALRDVDSALIHATPSLGIVRCILSGGTPLSSLRSLIESTKGSTAIFERLPSAAWDEMSPSVTTDRVSQGIRRAFDPSSILNPGIMGPLV